MRRDAKANIVMWRPSVRFYLDSVVEDLGSGVQRDILEGHDFGGLPASLGFVEFNPHHVVGKILSKLQRIDIWFGLELLRRGEVHFHVRVLSA